MAARVEVLRPPDERLTAWQWARRNLFDGLWNSLLTLLTVAALLFFASMILRWAARAPWSVITDNPRFWLMGLLPVELAPRAVSVPVGVLVGMGRVSRLPAIRVFSILYIELIRGSPLITILLWFFIFVALVSGGALSRVERAMVGLIIFTSAYVGEIVRAGIQSVPRGQTEAARAVGLSAVQTMRFIVLPQAVKNMIPSLVGQFISLFKDTSLTVIIGLSDLVGTGRSLLAITRYLQDTQEVFVFLLVVYFIFSYLMSYGSRILEKRLGLGER